MFGRLLLFESDLIGKAENHFQYLLEAPIIEGDECALVFHNIGSIYRRKEGEGVIILLHGEKFHSIWN